MPPKKATDQLQTTCATCALTQFCLPMGLTERELKDLEALVKHRRIFSRGEILHQPGDFFQNFYAIRAGAVKSVTINTAGNEQVFGFYLPGEVIGFEAISTQKYPHSIIALTETSICELPFTHLMQMSKTHSGLQHQLLALASQRLTIDTCIHFTDTQQRVIAFLLNVSARLNRSAGLKRIFDLPMSRHDIGNHLGLAMETISRIIHHLKRQGLLAVHHRSIELLKIPALKALATGNK